MMRSSNQIPANLEKQKDYANHGQITSELQSASIVWQKVESRLCKVLGERVHRSWTGQLNLQSEDENLVVLSVPSKFVANRIDDRYGELVQKIWAEFDSRRISIEMAQKQRPAKTRHVNSGFSAGHSGGLSGVLSGSGRVSSPSSSVGVFSQNSLSHSKGGAINAQQSERFSFDNFVVGPSNELAFAVSRRVASANESQYNPVVIYGPHGMGKTHLLHAVQTEAVKINPSRRVRLISSEEFVTSFVGSVRAQGRSRIDAFKAGLRDVDLLIIDDAHFIAAKPGSGEELMHTLISLVEAGKQVMLAVDRHPHEILGASDRLKSYLCGGLLCDIGPADYELRRRILDRLIERRRQGGNPALTIPQDARDHLAARINATPRDLEGAFNQIVARLEFLGKPLTLDSIQEALAHARYAGQVRPTVDKIQRATVEQFGLRMDDLLSKRRARAIARPRQIAMYVCKKLTTRSLPDIGRRFGGRDHTTVIHAVKKIEALRASDPAINQQVETLINTLKTAR